MTPAWISTRRTSWPTSGAGRIGAYGPNVTVLRDFIPIFAAAAVDFSKHKRNMPVERLCGTQDRVKWWFRATPMATPFQHHLEFAGNAGALAGGASAAALAAREVFWRRAVTGRKAHHAHAGLHTVCESARCPNMASAGNTAPRHS